MTSLTIAAVVNGGYSGCLMSQLWQSEGPWITIHSLLVLALRSVACRHDDVGGRVAIVLRYPLL